MPRARGRRSPSSGPGSARPTGCGVGIRSTTRRGDRRSPCPRGGVRRHTPRVDDLLLDDGRAVGRTPGGNAVRRLARLAGGAEPPRSPERAVHVLERRSARARRHRADPARPRDAATCPRCGRAMVVAPPMPRARSVRDAAPSRSWSPTPLTQGQGLKLSSARLGGTARPGRRLVVTGIPPNRARAFLARHGVPLPERAEMAGMLARHDFAALLGRAERVPQRRPLGGFRSGAA